MVFRLGWMYIRASRNACPSGGLDRTRHRDPDGEGKQHVSLPHDYNTYPVHNGKDEAYAHCDPHLLPDQTPMTTPISARR